MDCSINTQNTLKAAFGDSLQLLPYSTAFSVEGLTDQKISNIINEKGLYPIFLGSGKFTVIPYSGESFLPVPFDTESSSSTRRSLVAQDSVNNNGSSYLSFDEICHFLNPCVFKEKPKIVPDRWINSNPGRQSVAPALNKAVSEVVLKYLKTNQMAVEIGSGICYSFSDEVSSRIVRTQPNTDECHLLKTTTDNPIYQTDVKGIHDRVIESGKKVPLFIALNVFDTLTPQQRKEAFLQISRLQHSGDHLVIMLDTNPLLDTIFEELSSDFPNCTPVPYYPLNPDLSNEKVSIVPLEYLPEKKKFTIEEFNNLAKISYTSLYESKRDSMDFQQSLHQLQEQKSLPIIDLESYFTKKVRKELKHQGYKVSVFYHAAFSIGCISENLINQAVIHKSDDLIYKPVTAAAASIAFWNLKEKVLLDKLAEKNIQIPKFSVEQLEEMRENNMKILCAEVLVIVGTKA